ncbi:conserved hypothetical protein [Ricinus communis]|uniref:Uncharacterized protein n=1 Tax=Ricinus communis TaxID=3988 RepID=B9TED5_RICCO|nr:conserved hypothetical protein [Ricinus communis]
MLPSVNVLPDSIFANVPSSRCTLRPNACVSSTATVEVERRGRLSWIASSLPETSVAGVR